MSVGKKCLSEGFAFYWLPGKTPCLISPEGDIIPLDVDKGVPYLRENGLWKKIRGDPTAIAKLTGLRIVDGWLRVIQTSATRYPAAANVEKKPKVKEEPSDTSVAPLDEDDDTKEDVEEEIGVVKEEDETEGSTRGTTLRLRSQPGYY